MSTDCAPAEPLTCSVVTSAMASVPEVGSAALIWMLPPASVITAASAAASMSMVSVPAAKLDVTVSSFRSSRPSAEEAKSPFPYGLLIARACVSVCGRRRRLSWEPDSCFLRESSQLERVIIRSQSFEGV